MHTELAAAQRGGGTTGGPFQVRRIAVISGTRMRVPRLLSGTFIVAFAGLPLLAGAAPHKVLDLRTMSEASGEYEVSLCSRPSPSGSTPGHAYVIYSAKLTGQSRQVLSVGFTTAAGPAKAALSYLGWMPAVPGHLSEEIYTSIKERCVVTVVNKKTFEDAWAVAHPFAKLPALSSLTFSGEYRLGVNDCMTFMVSVAKVLKGVVVPSRGVTELPQAYLRRLIDSN